MNKVGSLGEDLAVKYLTKLGYKIIERNKRFSKLCEIDIIAKDKNTIVFVEVKTRKTDSLGSPFEAITKNKLNNMRMGVFSYLQEKNLKESFRMDAISIVLTPEIKINHLKNVGCF